MLPHKTRFGGGRKSSGNGMDTRARRSRASERRIQNHASPNTGFIRIKANANCSRAPRAEKSPSYVLKLSIVCPHQWEVWTLCPSGSVVQPWGQSSRSTQGAWSARSASTKARNCVSGRPGCFFRFCTHRPYRRFQCS